MNSTSTSTASANPTAQTTAAQTVTGQTANAQTASAQNAGAQNATGQTSSVPERMDPDAVAASLARETTPRRRGRPTILTEELLEELCAVIRLHGISDSMAAQSLGISTSTISRWKQEDEDFATDLGQARAQFEIARLTRIRQHRKKDGSVDWRAEAWLLQRTNPVQYGPPSRRQVPKTDDKAAPNGGFVLTVEMQADLHRRRAAALEAMKKSEPVQTDANLPENPTSPEAAV